MAHPEFLGSHLYMLTVLYRKQLWLSTWRSFPHPLTTGVHSGSWGKNARNANPRSRTLWHQTKKFPQVPCLLKRNNSRKMSYDITQSSYLEFGPNEAIFICSHYNQLDNEHLILFSFSSLIFHYLILAGHLPVKLFVFISSSQHLLRGESKIRLTSHFFFQS